MSAADLAAIDRDAQIATAIADGEQRLAALGSDDDLGPSARETIFRERNRLTGRLTVLRQSRDALAEASIADHLTAWRDHLTAWRAELAAEQPASTSVQLSLKVIDRGTGVLTDSGFDLTTIALGRLMIRDGYRVEGIDRSRNYGGRLPWNGSLPEVTRALTHLTTRRAEAEQALAIELLDDEARAQHEAEQKQRRDEQNALPQRKVADDGHVYFKGGTAPLPDLDEATARWRADLVECRGLIEDELAALPAELETAKQLGRARSLELSLLVIEDGPAVLDATGYALDTCVLGQLLQERGYKLLGADPNANYRGELEWHGSLGQLAAQDAARQRRQREIDAVNDRITPEHEAELNAAHSSMTVKLIDEELVAFKLHVRGEPRVRLSLDDMTPLQLEAFERAQRAHREYLDERRPRGTS